MVRGKSARVAGTMPEALVPQVVEAARRTVRGGKSQVHAVEAGATRAEVFVEVVKPMVRLVVFGSDASAGPLVGAGKELGWNVVVCDRRASEGKFPMADQVVAGRAEDVAQW